MNDVREREVLITITESKNISHVQCTQRYICTFVRTSERDREREDRFRPLFSFSPPSIHPSFSLSRVKERERESLKFFLVRTYTAYCSLAYIFIHAIDTVHRPMKFQNWRVKRAEKTTATTTIGRK